MSIASARSRSLLLALPISLSPPPPSLNLSRSPHSCSICNRIFITFKCEEVGGVYYLEADWRKRCFVDEEWWFYAALAGAGALVYIVGLPITITLALLHHHKRSRLRYPRLGSLTPASIAASVIESEKHYRVRLKYGDL